MIGFASPCRGRVQRREVVDFALVHIVAPEPAPPPAIEEADCEAVTQTAFAGMIDRCPMTVNRMVKDGRIRGPAKVNARPKRSGGG
jgi:hypothetical protein